MQTTTTDLSSSNMEMLMLFIIILLQLHVSCSHRQTYIVHMDSSSMPMPFLSHSHWYSSILQSTNSEPSSSGSTELIYTYTTAIHGFSAKLSPAELKAIQKTPGFVSATIDIPLQLATTRSAEFLGLNSLSGAWPASDYGRNVIIGVVDTGVWPESPSFVEEGMSEVPKRWKGRCQTGRDQLLNSSFCNNKLIGAQYFNKGLIAALPPNETATTNSSIFHSPRDEDGHGTHVSSTAAGNHVYGASYFGYASGTARGMAPRAHLAVYKVAFPQGMYSSDVIAAIDQALSDGVDVLSLSIGYTDDARFKFPPLYEDIYAIVTFAAMEKGVFVSMAAGNFGQPKTIFSGTPWVLTVGAGTIDRAFEGRIVLVSGTGKGIRSSSSVSLVGSSLYTGSKKDVTSPLPLLFVKSCENQKELKGVARKIVVCRLKQDSDDDYEAYLNQVGLVKSAGAVGVIFISNFSDSIELTSGDDHLPFLFLNPSNGKILEEYVRRAPFPKGSMHFGGASLGTRTAPKVAPFSSRGPSVGCPFVLKPDLIAPGFPILASWATNVPVFFEEPNVFTGFNLESGTSMASPHVAGVAALLRGAHPEWSPAAIRSAMMTTADTVDNAGSPIQDLGVADGEPSTATPLAMGAGNLNPNRALDPGLVYDAAPLDYVNFLCALNNITAAQIRSITRSPNFTCSDPSLDVNHPSFIAFFDAHNCRENEKEILVRRFQRRLTFVGDNDEMAFPVVYSAQLIRPVSGYTVKVQPNNLIFREKYETQVYNLTISGPCLSTAGEVAHGFLSWVEFGQGSHHRVTSPIVITTFPS